MSEKIPTMSTAIASTRVWLESVVLGLELCPFAQQPWQAGRVLIQACQPDGLEAALTDILAAAAALVRGPHETTLLVIEGDVAASFEALLELIEIAEALLEESGHGLSTQLVGFHPAFQYAGTRTDDVSNATNRSPLPMVHLLRRGDVARAAAQHPDVHGIPATNQSRLRALGWEGLRRLGVELEDSARPSAPSAGVATPEDDRANWAATVENE